MRTRTVIFVVATYLLSACSPGTGSAASESTGTQEQDVVESAPDQSVATLVPTLTNLETDTSSEPPALNIRVADQQTYHFAQLIPRDGIMPIYDPVFESAMQAPLQDEELVLGLTLNGESKAYPITVLRRREMVNDQLGGIPILVTW